jgi:hypothetical protein
VRPWPWIFDHAMPVTGRAEGHVVMPFGLLLAFPVSVLLMCVEIHRRFSAIVICTVHVDVSADLLLLLLCVRIIACGS